MTLWMCSDVLFQTQGGLHELRDATFLLSRDVAIDTIKGPERATLQGVQGKGIVSWWSHSVGSVLRGTGFLNSGATRSAGIKGLVFGISDCVNPSLTLQLACPWAR